MELQQPHLLQKAQLAVLAHSRGTLLRLGLWAPTRRPWVDKVVLWEMGSTPPDEVPIRGALPEASPSFAALVSAVMHVAPAAFAHWAATPCPSSPAKVRDDGSVAAARLAISSLQTLHARAHAAPDTESILTGKPARCARSQVTA